MDGNSPNCVSLSQYGREVSNVAWSADLRIAVTTPDVVFVCTLKSPGGSNDMSRGTTATNRPPLNITSAHAPPNDVKVSMALSTGSTAKRMMEFVDPVFIGTPQSHDTFKTSDWSPAGCTPFGGCVLTSTTSRGRLLLHSPPHSMWKVWKLTLDLTTLLSKIKSTDFPLIPSPSAHQEGQPAHRRGSETGQTSSRFEHLLTVCTAFSWLPYTMNSVDGEQSAVIAMATRSGHVLIVEIPTPVTETRDVRPVNMCDVPGCDGEGGWVCSLQWTSSQQGFTALAAGCTDGRVFEVSWSKVKVHSRADLKEPTLTLLWQHIDSMPVHHLAWQKQESGKSVQVLVFNKGSCLMAVSSGKKASEKDRVCVAGYHSLPVSGLAALPDGTFISSALDGTLQTFTLPHILSRKGSHDSHVTPEPVETCVSAGVAVSIQGVATSHHGLLASFSVNQSMNLEKKQSSFLYFVKLTDVGKIEQCLNSEDCESTWDIIECVRQFYLQGTQLPPSLLSMLKTPSNFSSGISVPGPLLQAALQTSVIMEQEPGPVIESRRQILYHYVTQWLNEWTQLMDVAMETESQMDKQSSILLKLMCRWLQKYGYHGDMDGQLVEQVLTKCPSGDDPSEPCPACGETMLLSNPLSYSCTNGHHWNLCPLTFHLVGCSKCRSCVQCGWGVNSTSSLRIEQGTWSYFHLSQHMECLFCGGYFEQIT